MTEPRLHPLVAEAARGWLPEWAVVGASRMTHIEGVAGLMQRWAGDLGLEERDRLRWSAAAYLHDALRDAEPDSLREADDWPRKLRHGPAVAARLQAAGVDDGQLLDAIRYHTLGYSDWDDLGRFLYLADYLEPGRAHEPARRAALRARLPERQREVLRVVCAARLWESLRRGRPLRPESLNFWNSLRSGP